MNKDLEIYHSVIPANSFLTQRHKMFFLGVSGFSKTTRLYISEDVPNNSEVLKEMIMLHTDVPVRLNIRDFTESRVIYSFNMDFSFLA